MQELDALAEQQSVKPPAAAGAGTEHHVEWDAHQAGADTRAGQVFDEAVGHGFEDVCAAGAPQHRGISCRGGEKRCFKWDHTPSNPIQVDLIHSVIAMILRISGGELYFLHFILTGKMQMRFFCKSKQAFFPSRSLKSRLKAEEIN